MLIRYRREREREIEAVTTVIGTSGTERFGLIINSYLCALSEEK